MEMIKKQFSDNLQKFLSEDKWMIIQEDYKQEENLKYVSQFGIFASSLINVSDLSNTPFM